MRGRVIHPLLTFALIVVNAWYIMLLLGTITAPGFPDAADSVWFDQSNPVSATPLEIKGVEIISKASMNSGMRDAEQLILQARSLGIRTECPEIRKRMAALEIHLADESDTTLRSQPAFRIMGGYSENGEDVGGFFQSEFFRGATADTSDATMTADQIRFRIGYTNRPPTPPQIETLRRELRWFGDLVAARYAAANDPIRARVERSPRKFLIAFGLIAVTFALTLVDSLICVLIFLIRVTTGRIRFVMNLKRLISGEHVAIYVEMVAVTLTIATVPLLILRLLQIPKTSATTVLWMVACAVGISWPVIRNLDRPRAAF